MGLNGSLNHAIMIRSFCCYKNTITYQAGAGVVIGSTPEGELSEVNNKIAALRQALKQAGLNYN
jgi:anthranilate synthase component 1